ncbi:DUF1569 domain-containing protein [Winogradskyella sp.]|jgi:hypothetical protein|uniref:DUF1569 domain-containing protein n=1 Tax=Winogradskyella sp. TaxID=1883156 RepID=UPI0025CFA07B|nr:DUF1569 domain-containing protein [Winogradskyella sp.]MCT4630195.1 DUF1569 domain-containing protein [Winogradskyella sp.]
MKSIFEENAYNEIMERVNKLNGSTTAIWGKMNVGQMVWHCQGPLNILLEKNNYDMKPSWIAKLFFKKSLYNNKPWKKGLPTAKFLKTKDTKDFTVEKTKLQALIQEAYSHKDKTEWNLHPAFGYFTAQQWGQMQYKHLDHHFRQFGV